MSPFISSNQKDISGHFLKAGLSQKEQTALRTLLFFLILVAAAFLRFTGLNWDHGEWIHPDEGHMRIITGAVHLPDDPSLYFDTANSPLNPMNNGQVYSYGTLPLFLTRAAAEWLEKGCGDSSHWLSALISNALVRKLGGECGPGTFTIFYSAFIGRFFSALADLGRVILIFLIGRRLYGDAVGLLAMGLGAFTAFLIQQAHFFTVDSITCFFMIAAAFFAIRAASRSSDKGPSWVDFGIAGTAVGLAAASKVSAGLAAGFVVLAGIWWVLQFLSDTQRSDWKKPLLAIAFPLIFSGILSFMAFRIAQPYAFEGPGILGILPDKEWLSRLSEISAEQNGDVDYPSGRQWVNRTPVIFPWVNIVIWGMGLFLGIPAWLGWVYMGVELFRGQFQHLVLWLWGTMFFFFQATRWVKAMRYFLPLYPILIIMAAYALISLWHRLSPRFRSMGTGIIAAVVLGTMIWGWAVFSIYLRPHTRIAGSEWVYANVPAGSVVANEHWDWGLPLRLGHNPFPDLYIEVELQNYNEDTLEKFNQLAQWLDMSDFIFLASNRLYASIPRLPERYPLTNAFYRALFSGQLGFELAAEFTSYPSVGPIYFPDQENPISLMVPEYRSQTGFPVLLPPAEESFSVYDHPTVLIFRKTTRYSRQQVIDILSGVNLSDVKQWQSPREATSQSNLKAHNPLYYLAFVGVLLVGWWGFDRKKP